MKKIFSFLIILCCTFTSCSEDVVSTFGSVYGVIYDSSTASPLRSVSVNLSPGNMTYVTGSDGQYEFTDLEAGQYKITIESEGYESNSRQITIVPGVRVVCDFHMSAIVVNQTLKLSTNNLNFGTTQNELSVSITNEGNTETPWSLDMGNNNWLTANPSSGRIAAGKTQSIIFSVNRELISESKAVIVNLAAFGNSYPISIVCAPAQAQAAINVYPKTLNFGSIQNSLKLTIENLKPSSNIAYDVESSNNWLILSKTSGNVATTDYLDVIVSREGLSSGEYNATINFYNSKQDIIATVDVKMEVAVNQKPSVSINTVDGVGYDQVFLTGTILSVGSSAITKHGFCWSDKPEPTVDDLSSNLGYCSTPLAFEFVAKDLKANTKYYFRAYAENALGISYSQKELTWTTSDIPLPPAVTTGDISQITQTTALAQGEITSLCNGGEITAYGHVWGTSENPTITSGKRVDFGKTPEPKSFSSQISGLTPNTEYFVRAYATNAIGTAYGECVKFITAKADLNIETLPATDIIHNAATCGGKIKGYQGHTIIEKGVCYSTKSMPTINDYCVQAADLATSSISVKEELIPTQTIAVIPDQYTCRVTGLTTETMYYVRAYAKTAEDKIFYGDEKSFTTTKEVFLPTLADVNISNIQTTSATVVSKILSDGNGTITECGFCYSETAEPTIDNGTKILCDTASSELGKNITGLKDNTLYHVRAFAKNAIGVAYSNDAEFTTLSVTTPTLSGVTVESVGRTTAYVSATITDTGNATLSECGFCWSLSPYPTIYDNRVVCDTKTSFSTKLQELPLLTTVYVRAYAINTKGTGYSEDTSFTTTDSDIDVWDGVSVATKFGGGMGTESDPIIINTADQLKLLADNVNSGTAYSGVHFSLTANLNLDNHAWNPIGLSENTPFMGSFNGNNHIIEGLKVSSNNSYVGLFGYITRGEYISNLYLKGSIKGNHYVGGLCGMAYNYKIISNCHSLCDVSGEKFVGGLIGYVECDTAITFTLVNCSNQGNIHGKESIGGIIGYSKCYGYNSGRYANIKITNVINRGSIDANNYAGGIIGYLYNDAGTYYGTSYTTMSNCVNYSNVTVSDSYSYKGGIIGYAKYSTNSDEQLTLVNVFWLNDIVNNVGLEIGFGYIQPMNGGVPELNNCLYFMRSNTSCMLSSEADLNSTLNQWIDDNTDSSLRKWKYEIIDGYATPVFEE